MTITSGRAASSEHAFGRLRCDSIQSGHMAHRLTWMRFTIIVRTTHTVNWQWWCLSLCVCVPALAAADFSYCCTWIDNFICVYDLCYGTVGALRNICIRNEWRMAINSLTARLICGARRPAKSWLSLLKLRRRRRQCVTDWVCEIGVRGVRGTANTGRSVQRQSAVTFVQLRRNMEYDKWVCNCFAKRLFAITD